MNSSDPKTDRAENPAPPDTASEPSGEVNGELRGRLSIEDAAQLVGCSVSTIHRASAELAPMVDARGKRWYDVDRLLEARETGRFAKSTKVRGEQRAEQIREGFRLLQAGMDPRQVVIELGDFELVEQMYRAWKRLAPDSPKAAPAQTPLSADPEAAARLRWAEKVNEPGTPEYEAQQRELDALLATRQTQRSGTRTARKPAHPPHTRSSPEHQPSLPTQDTAAPTARAAAFQRGSAKPMDASDGVEGPT